MALYPPRSSTPWDLTLKAYVDDEIGNLTTYVDDEVAGLGATLDETYVGAVVAKGTGIDPTGVSNSAAAINAKAASAAAFGARFHLPDGTYLMGTTSFDLPSGLDMVGDGHGSVLQFSGVGAGIQYLRNTGRAGAGNTDIRIAHLTLMGPGDGNPTDPATSPGSGLYMRYAENVTVEGVKFYRMPGVAMSLQGAKNVRVINNTVSECGRGGLVVTGYATTEMRDVIIGGNVIRGVADDAIAVNTDALGTGTGTLTQGNGISIFGNRIFGNASDAVTATYGRGIHVLGCSDVSITGNTIRDTFGPGIYAHRDESDTIRSTDIVITGNVLYRAGQPGASGTAEHGVLIAGADRVTIGHNNVQRSKLSGIEVNDCSGFEVVGNIVTDCGTGTADCGIFINALAGTRVVTRGVIGQNVVTGSRGPGIRVRDASLIKLTGNHCADNGAGGGASAATASGITITTVGDVTVHENTCTDTRSSGKTQTYGISFVAPAAASAIVTDNHLLGNNTSGLLLSTAPTYLIKRGNLESLTPQGNYDQDMAGIRYYGSLIQPEGNIAAPVGSACWVIDGSTWRKDSGAATTLGWVREAHHVTANTAALANIANAINTTNKYQGKQVYNTSTGRPVWAANSAAGDVWKFADGTTAHTPV